jgi:hypothetical protein
MQDFRVASETSIREIVISENISQSKIHQDRPEVNTAEVPPSPKVSTQESPMRRTSDIQQSFTAGNSLTAQDPQVRRNLRRGVRPPMRYVDFVK